ncbi:MAG: transcriptional repressor LexA [Candidatus Zapsychrus exili]|nr:transcriptional repressor LexA [Candidatus Zapsychrus exili]
MNETANLTEKQFQVLKHIYKSIRDDNFPPTIRELADNFSLSVGAVQDHLKALVKKGFISISKNTSRGIRLVREQLFKVPVLGRVRAGMPAYAVEDLEGYLDMDDMIFPDKDIFALRVKGDSMKDAGIFSGDFILIKKQESAEHGDIVVALIGQEDATVKMLRKRDGGYFLDPANDAYQPIPVTTEVSIAGKVIKVLRSYK